MLDTETRLRLAEEAEKKEAAEQRSRYVFQTLGTVFCGIAAFHVWGWWGLLGLLGLLWRFSR